MAASLQSRHIPTIVGILILVGGLVGGIFLANSATTGFLPRASPETTPKNIKVTNVTDTSFTVSWITDSKTTGYIKYGTVANTLSLTATDDRDQVSGTTGTYRTHHVTIRGLKASTAYYYKLGTTSTLLYDNNGQPYQTSTTTAVSSNARTIYGQVLLSTQTGVGGALVYISSPDMAPLSVITQSTGSFVLSLSQARTKSLTSAATLSDSMPLDVFIQGDDATSVITATLDLAQPLPDVTLGKNQDLTQAAPTSAAVTPTPNLTMTEIQSKFSAQLLAPPTESSSSAQTLKISAPAEGSVQTIRKPKILGEAPKSTRIALQFMGPTNLKTTILSTSAGVWSYTPTSLLPNGDYTLTATATSSGKTESSQIHFSVAVATPTPRPVVESASTSATLPVSGNQEMTVMLVLAGVLLMSSGIVFASQSTKQSEVSSL